MPGPLKPIPSHPIYPNGTPVLDLTHDLSAYREDGSIKGSGFLGSLLRPDGAVMSEYSIADSEKLRDARGNYLDYPSLVPTLTADEVNAILTNRDGQPLPRSVYQKAEAFALQRRAQGKSLFAQPGEENINMFPQFHRALAIAPSMKRDALLRALGGGAR